jgi:vacuolar-type H+-ATPase subunit I/STV1
VGFLSYLGRKIRNSFLMGLCLVLFLGFAIGVAEYFTGIDIFGTVIKIGLFLVRVVQIIYETIKEIIVSWR